MASFLIVNKFLSILLRLQIPCIYVTVTYRYTNMKLYIFCVIYQITIDIIQHLYAYTTVCTRVCVCDGYYNKIQKIQSSHSMLPLTFFIIHYCLCQTVVYQRVTNVYTQCIEKQGNPKDTVATSAHGS